MSVLVLRHVPHESLGTIETAFTKRELPLEVVDLWSQPCPQFAANRWSGIVVMGGPMNVDEVERHPFLADEVKLIQQAVAADVPVLGVCLGSQLLAKALGVQVYANPIKEIGWYDVEWLPAASDDALFAGLTTQKTVFQWHGDTFPLPAGAVLLARSAACQQQAFRFGRAAYGLQFHIEMTADMVADWLCEPGMCAEVSGLPYIDAEKIATETPRHLPAMMRMAEVVFGRFAAMCE